MTWNYLDHETSALFVIFYVDTFTIKRLFSLSHVFQIFIIWLDCVNFREITWWQTVVFFVLCWFFPRIIRCKSKFRVIRRELIRMCPPPYEKFVDKRTRRRRMCACSVQPPFLSMYGTESQTITSRNGSIGITRRRRLVHYIAKIYQTSGVMYDDICVIIFTFFGC